MHEAHDALICIGNKTYVNDKSRIRLSNQHYFKNNSEMSELFADLPEALENNYNFPLRCSFRPLFSNPILPNISSEKGGNADDVLKKDSLHGLRIKFDKIFGIKANDLEKNKTYIHYKDRLDHELSIIIEMKYSSYFLIVSDYIKWAKNNDIPVGPGRGSGAGSLVAWCLSITDVDPIKFNLIFERFLNPDRISMPDFDIDFCEEKRDLVFEYLTKKYQDSVAHIITFGKLKARMVIRDVGRVLGLPYGFVDSISKMIPFDPSRPQSLSQCIAGEPRLQKLVNEDPRVKKLTEISLKLEGLNRNVATHAAGVVIADKKLTEIVPLYKDASANLLLPSTQFDMYSAENAGLIKFDFLGLKTLTVINNTQKLVRKFNKDFDIENISYEDQKVFDLLSSGNTVGLFQVESAGMREALVQMKPNHIEDIIALVALYRPGPMSNIPTYNDCKHGRQTPDYLHPLLEDILKPTYGVIIYQEQVMQIAQKLSGFTAGQADLLRRAMGKKKRAELEKQKQGFIAGALKNGIAKDVAAGIEAQEAQNEKLAAQGEARLQEQQMAEKQRIQSIQISEGGRAQNAAAQGAAFQFSAQENITCIVPNLNALETIDWICSRLTTKNGSPYFCFATLNIPHYKEGFVVTGEEDIKEGNVIRLGNLDTMLEQEPFNKIPYKFTPQTNSTNANQSREKQVFNIRAIETPASSNTLKLIDIGAISSTYSNTNLGTGEVHKSEHSIVRTLSNISKDDIIEKEGKVQNVIDPTAKFKDKNILRYKSRNFHTITSSGTYGNLNSYHDERVESKFKTKIESKSIKAFLNKNPLTIVIEGSGFIVGRGGVGQIISIDIRGDNVRAEKREELSDSRYSGNHLIYDVKHHFAANLHNVTLNLRKLESKL